MRISSSASRTSRSRDIGRRKRRRMPAGNGRESLLMASSWVENAGQGGDVVFPRRDFVAQLSASLGGQRVVFRPPIVVRRAPLGVYGAGVLEAMECFVQR